MSTEAICYLLRKTNLTRSEIGKLSPAQFAEILRETLYQESIDEYRRQYGLAALLSAIYNTIPRKRGSKANKPSDFLKGDMPQRDAPPEIDLEELVAKRGIRLPTKDLRER